MKYVAWLEDLYDRAVFVVGRFQAIHGLMQMRIELLSDRIDSLNAELGEVLDELFIDELETPCCKPRTPSPGALPAHARTHR